MVTIFTLIKKHIFKILTIITTIFLFFLYQIFMMMVIEDKLGDFCELYYSMNKSNSYLAFINDKKVGFIEKMDDDIYFLEDRCLIHILEFSNEKMEVYKVDIHQTYINLNINQALKLKNNSNSELIFKN